MPIYEYICAKCGRLEVFQRITDDPLSRCPTCQRQVKKIISQSSFHLKGSGWYVTDYARKGGGEAKRTGETAETSASPASTDASEPKKQSTVKEKEKVSGAGSGST
jgi:putative FmdB family regulatory protein